MAKLRAACGGPREWKTEQPGGGDEEDWEPVTLYRRHRRSAPGAYIVAGTARLPELEYRRYAPAASQDSSGPSNEVKEITIAWAEQRDRANAVEREKHKAIECAADLSVELRHERDRAERAETALEEARDALIAAEQLAHRLRGRVANHRTRADRAEVALDELAAWAEDRAARLTEAAKVATKEKLIPEELSANLHMTFAAAAREKVAEPKGGR